MENNHKSSVENDRIHCFVCNVFVDCHLHFSHIQGKKHRKNVIQAENAAKKNPDCKPNFISQGPASLDIQFNSFLDQVLLSQEDCASTSSNILRDLEPCLTREFGRCFPYIFGSMSTGLALVGSDVDLYLDTGIYNHLRTLEDRKPVLQQVVKRCARALRMDRRFSRIIPITTARVPIVKFMHTLSGVSCDISFQDSLGVHNSQLLKFYLYLNPRIFEVMVAIKFWAKESGFCKCDGISSYAWTLLFISYLQTVKFPNGNSVLPSVYDLQRGFPPVPWLLVNDWRVDFHPSQEFIRLPDEPQYSHLGLLKGFFDYYKRFSFEDYVICPFLGQPIPWKSLVDKENDAFPPQFIWYQSAMKTHLANKVGQTVSIQDPFQHDFLLGGSCSRKNFERVIKCLDAASQVCQAEQELADPNTSLFLATLFTSQPAEQEDKIKIHLKDIENRQKQAIAEQAFVLLEDIFTKIMRFEVTIQSDECSTPRGEPEMKVLKKTEDRDVHQPTDIVPREKKYNCVAVYPVWRFRKKSRKKVQLKFPETAFEFEAKLSDVIVNHGYPEEQLEFSCTAEMKKSLVVFLTLKQVTKQHNNAIREVFLFLKNNLQGWMNTFLLEHFGEPSGAVAPPPKPSSSKNDLSDAEDEDSGNLEPVRSCLESGAVCDDSNSSLEAIGDQTQKENVDNVLKESLDTVVLS